MYVVMGVSGHTGRVVAETLLAQGERVRAVVRDAKRAGALAARGAEVAVASLEAPDTLAAAFAGARGAYVLVPPGYEYRGEDYLDHQRRQVDRLARAVRVGRPERVVLLSSVAAHLDRGTGPIASVRFAEQALADLPGLRSLRPSFFLENFEAVLGAARADGILPTFVPEGRHAMVGAVDIGTTAAELLTSAAAPRVTELAGPVDPTVEEVAEAIGAALGRTVRVHRGPVAAAAEALAGMGMTRSLAGLYGELFEAMASGHLAFEGAPRRGTTPLAQAIGRLIAAAGGAPADPQ